MLTKLTIKDLAIVDSLEIEFGRGFNVITGETGAGKSILIKAMGLLLGAKGSHEIVRSGSESATVIGSFNFPATHQILSILEKYDLPIEQEGQNEFAMIIRRVVSTKGRSSAWINDVPVANTTLKDVAETMIDVMSQFEHHKLVDAGTHLHLVDQFVGDDSAAGEWDRAYQAVDQVKTQLRERLEAVSRISKDRDFLAFRLKELEDFNPSAEDYAKLYERCESYKSFETTKVALNTAQEILDSGYQGDALAKALREIQKALTSIGSSALVEGFHSLEAQLNDLSYEVGKLSSKYEFDEDSIASDQDRLSEYYTLFRKLSVRDGEELEKEFERLKSELQFAGEAQERLTTLVDELEAATKQLRKAGLKLSAARKTGSEKLSKLIEQELRELAMPQASVKVELLPNETRALDMDSAILESESARKKLQNILDVLAGVSIHGLEKAQILLKSNAGENYLPLHRVISGGESSRMLLAFKKAVVAGGDTCILVFDEIDTGISGRVADIVGKKLRTLSKKYQIICVSHIPQVVAHADVNFRVAKSVKSGRTESTIVRLSESESVEELARLLSGTKLTQDSLKNAKTLRNQAKGQ